MHKFTTLQVALELYNSRATLAPVVVGTVLAEVSASSFILVSGKEHASAHPSSSPRHALPSTLLFRGGDIFTPQTSPKVCWQRDAEMGRFAYSMRPPAVWRTTCSVARRR